jgi:UDP-N-acetylglucosamine 2-epimerase (non-hydrolysing)
MKVSIVFGTRPEAIKLCPVVLAMKRNPAFDCNVCVTGQHREMLRQVLDVFGVEPDADLALMKPNQTLADLTSRAIASLDRYLDREKPDAVMVQGDTTTVLCASLAAFYRHIPVAHVEAGLRTWDLDSPWPEEGNRQLASRLTRWHFAPTESNRRNLLRDGIDGARIFVTGNTVIDALLLARAMASRNPPPVPGLPDDGRNFPGRGRMVLITGHRRENFGEGFDNICRSIRLLAERHPDVQFVYPVHLNPNVREPVFRILGEAAPDNIHLIAPQCYLSFVSLMDRATLLLTDSGGVQEEAPSLGKPVLVMRDTTERPEAVEAGTAKLVGTKTDDIVSAVSELLADEDVYARMAHAVNPYGDGHAVERILSVLENTP